MSLKLPPGSKIFEIEWLNEQIFILTSITQLRKFKKWNEIPDRVLCDDDWHLYSGRVITAVNSKIRYFFLLIKYPRASIIVHESVHLAEFILKHHDIKPKREALAYMSEHIFDKITKCLKIKEIK
jgi:hypothetical protein